MNGKLGGIAVAAIAAFLLVRSQSAKAVMIDSTERDAGESQPDVVIDIANPEPQDEQLYEVQPMTNQSADNIKAFLYMIRSCEHVFPRDVQDNACYSIFYGGSFFDSFADHPVITGEKVKVLFTPEQCSRYGYRYGEGWGSTAAGAYQIIKPTWSRIRELEPRLPDFSPASQDRAAIRLLDECGAMPYIEAGDFDSAIKKASKLWASLPGSNANQGGRSFDYALARYQESLTGVA